ncbi:MAG: hypothetical protein ACRD4B_04090 [Acidobacteriota bacterium]
MTTQVVAGKYAFDPSYKRRILDLKKHREPGYPVFVTLELRPLNNKRTAIESTMWYVDKKQLSDGRAVTRYHVQSQSGGKILPAFLDDKAALLKVVTESDKIDKI